MENFSLDNQFEKLAFEASRNNTSRGVARGVSLLGQQGEGAAFPRGCAAFVEALPLKQRSRQLTINLNILIYNILTVHISRAIGKKKTV